MSECFEGRGAWNMHSLRTLVLFLGGGESRSVCVKFFLFVEIVSFVRAEMSWLPLGPPA